VQLTGYAGKNKMGQTSCKENRQQNPSSLTYLPHMAADDWADIKNAVKRDN
jgi:hypothetical protein